MLTDLKNKVIADAAHQRELSNQARSTSGAARHSYNMQRRAYRSDARATLLIYAFTRGRPYRSVEPHTACAPEYLTLRVAHRYSSLDSKAFHAWLIEQAQADRAA